MTFGSSISTCLGKYANFKGRAIRSEYWWFYLFFVIISIVSSVISGVMFEIGDPMSQGLPAIVNLAFTLPLLSAGARRLHDIGKSIMIWHQILSDNPKQTSPCIPDLAKLYEDAFKSNQTF